MSTTRAAQRGRRRVTEAEWGICRALDFWEPPGA